MDSLWFPPAFLPLLKSNSLIEIEVNPSTPHFLPFSPTLSVYKLHFPFIYFFLQAACVWWYETTAEFYKN